MRSIATLGAGLIVLLMLVGACTLAPATPQAGLYTDRDFNVSLVIPAGWVIAGESYGQVILAPAGEQAWQPAAPAENAKDPRVTVDMGEYIRERLGPAGFPADVTPDSLRVWLEQRVQTGEARELAESTIAGVPAFTLTEVYDSGCERVVYWRPQALHRLVRLATGCESPHLAEFEYIAATLR